MSKKLFLGSLAMAVALPVMVAPVQAQEVGSEVSQDFKDVPKNHSAYKEIMAMLEQGIIDGYPDNMFKPAQSIIRVHVASSLVRSLDLPPVRVGKEFKDVPKKSPYYETVQKVYRAGIFDGKTNGTFGINDNLTRAQMAKVLVNAFKLDNHKGNFFTDVSKDHWAKDYISSLYMSGITVGSNGKYLPNDPVSRAHYAAFLYRALNPDDAPKPEKPLKSTPPVVKPEVKPDPPAKGNPFPGTYDIKPPSGWTESVTKEHEKKIADTVLQKSPKIGSGISFGRGSTQFADFDDPAFLALKEDVLKRHMSGMSINEYVADINKAIQTGEVVIAKDYSYGVYIKYTTLRDGTPFAIIITTM